MAYILTVIASFTYASLVRRLLPLVFPVFAIILTWPLASQLTTHIPLGSEPAETVPFFNVWTIAWKGKSLLTGFSGYWDAPIFHPVPGAFAFSDPQPITALCGALLWNSSPALAYNVILLAYLSLNGYVTHRVLRQRGIAAGPALAGSLLVRVLPFVTNERGVLQPQPLFGPIWRPINHSILGPCHRRWRSSPSYYWRSKDYQSYGVGTTVCPWPSQP